MMTTPSSNVGADGSRGHTVLPWGVDHHGGNTYVYREGVNKMATFAVACVGSGGKSSESSTATEANAAFIVRACNSHYELLAMLELTQDSVCNAYCSHREDGVTHVAECANARAAIAKARGAA